MTELDLLRVLLLTMVLAWRNELSLPAFGALHGIRGMVAVHGVLNAIVVGPTFLLAVALDGCPRNRRQME